MLERLLELLAAGEVASVSRLARTLGVNEPIVVALLEDLVRRGLLEVIESCQSSCEGCGVGKSCAAMLQGRAFVLSEAGRARLRSTQKASGETSD
jgi:hypothetical protein